MEALKHKNISLHLEEENFIADFTESARNQVKNIMQQFVKSHNVYLLVCRRKMVRSQLIEVIREVGAIEIGFESTEGAVAILRQLSCTTHLEGNLNLCNIILQYLPVVWHSSSSKVENAYNFRSELDMVLNLELSLKKKKEMKDD